MPVSAVYLGSAAIVAVLGAALFVWALFADRSRGRKRCPKCWYDMSAAVSLRCPECGHEAKHERRLLKTRRRWKPVLASMLVFALAGFLAVQPKVQRDGWWSVMPTTVMLAYFQFVQDDAVISALERRISEHHVHPAMGTPMFVPDGSTLYRWQWRIFARRVVNLLGQSDANAATLRLYVQWASSMREFVDNERLSAELLHSIVQQYQHDDQDVRTAAAMFSLNYADPAETLARIRPLLDDPNPRGRIGAVSALSTLMLYTGHIETADVLVKVLDDPDEDVRIMVAHALSSPARVHNSRSPALKEALLSALRSSSSEQGRFRNAAVRAIAVHQNENEIEPFLHEMLAHDDPNLRAGALEFVTMTEIDRRPFLQAIVRELLRLDATSEGRRDAAWLLHRWEDAEQLRPYENDLRRIVEHDDEETHQAAHAALWRIGIRLPRRLTPEEELLNAEL